jgi:SAM-dependent methyltransferase
MTRLPALLLVIALGSALAAAQAPQSSSRPVREPDVIFIASSDAVVDAMLSIAAVTRSDTVYDLGCGDGKILITAAKKLGARGVGIDIDPDRIREAKAAAAAAGVSDRVTFLQGDIFSDDVKIGDATVVMLYLLPSLNERLRPRLWRDLKPGTRVVSNSFAMGEAWPAEKTQQIDDRWIYFWTIPNLRYALSSVATSVPDRPARVVSP